ncbi:MAG: hypothetical protein JWL71_2571 [Acidobacteria bacterium]|nr:hypothetical protein [Acidobacteriota bacterium]
MQQRQLRLGDILDDYCPRERRVTNHVIVAMIGDDVKQVRCTTCDADHEFKHAKVPRQRRKSETPAALYAQVLATGPKRVAHEPPAANGAASAVASVPEVDEHDDEETMEPQAPALAAVADPVEPERAIAADADDPEAEPDDDAGNRAEEDGPIHRRLIRASLPKIDGAPPPTRAIPEFTIRQPAGRPGANRFRGPRPPRGGPGGGGGQQFQGNRSGGGGGNMHGGPRGAGGMRSNGGRPPQGPGGAQMRRNGPGRKRSR